MQLSWLKGAKTPEAKKERKALIQAALPTLKVLKEILELAINDSDYSAYRDLIEKALDKLSS